MSLYLENSRKKLDAVVHTCNSSDLEMGGGFSRSLEAHRAASLLSLYGTVPAQQETLSQTKSVNTRGCPLTSTCILYKHVPMPTYTPADNVYVCMHTHP